jgi:hypothetical protein
MDASTCLETRQFTPILRVARQQPAAANGAFMYRLNHYQRSVIVVAAGALLSACGLAETAATGAAGAANDIEAAKQAKQQGDEAVQKVEAAQQQEQEQREAALKQAAE